VVVSGANGDRADERAVVVCAVGGDRMGIKRGNRLSDHPRDDARPTGWRVMMRIRVVRTAMMVVLCSIWTAAMAADLPEIRQRGTLTVISFPHQESEFVRTNLDAGPTPELGTVANFEGVDIDLMAAFADRIGVELRVRRVSEPSYGALIPDLLAGQGDLIASSMSITDERKKRVDFSDPYFTVEKVVVSRVDSSISDVAALDGKRAVVIEGSSHYEHLKKLGVPDDSFLFVGFTLECFTAVADGQADYTLQDSAAARHHLRNDTRLEIRFKLPGEDHYGFAVPKDSPKLLAELNRFIAKTRKTGKLDDTIARHMDLE
jgi:polar amino acid transport system substrate-binding protein